MGEIKGIILIRLGIYRTGTDMDVVWVEFQGKYRMGTDMDLVLTKFQGIYTTDTDMDVVWVEC